MELPLSDSVALMSKDIASYSCIIFYDISYNSEKEFHGCRSELFSGRCGNSHKRLYQFLHLAGGSICLLLVLLFLFFCFRCSFVVVFVVLDDISISMI
jgi:hypothetical protein